MAYVTNCIASSAWTVCLHDTSKSFFLEELSDINSLTNFSVTTCKPRYIVLRSPELENIALMVINPINTLKETKKLMASYL